MNNPFDLDNYKPQVSFADLEKAKHYIELLIQLEGRKQQ